MSALHHPRCDAPVTRAGEAAVWMRWLANPPGWGRAALCTFSWILSAALVPHGPFVALLFVVPYLSWRFFDLVQARTITAAPADAARRRTWRGVSAVLAITSVLALLVTHLASWERETWHYASSPQAPDAGLERVRRSSAELLAEVAPVEASQFPELEVDVDSAHWTTIPSGLLALPPLALAGATLALFLLTALIVARAAARPAREWGPGVLEALLVWFGTLGLAHALAATVQGWRADLGGIADAMPARGEADEIAAVLYRALLEREMVVHAESRGRIVDRREGFELARFHTLAATTSSPFDRWRMSWRGPERTVPHLLIVVLSSAGGDRAFVTADAGLVERGSPEEREWSADLTRLLALGGG